MNRGLIAIGYELEETRGKTRNATVAPSVAEQGVLVTALQVGQRIGSYRRVEINLAQDLLE